MLKNKIALSRKQLFYAGISLLAVVASLTVILLSLSSSKVDTESFSKTESPKLTKNSKQIETSNSVSSEENKETSSSENSTSISQELSLETPKEEPVSISMSLEQDNTAISSTGTQTMTSELASTTAPSEHQNVSNDYVETVPVSVNYHSDSTNVASYPTQPSTNVYLSNGNTAGAVGSQAAAQMAAATGVSQSTWEYIIARESNGNPNVSNGSGASGLFQTMPGWGSTATVQDQINSAINAYNAQGLSAWGY